MPLYVGDYLRDTGHLTTEQHGAYMLLLMHCWQHDALPETANGRAAVARLTPKRWEVMAPTIERFFQPDGKHKRVEAEKEKTDRALMQRRLAGQRGGTQSAISRAAQSKFKRPVQSRSPPAETETKLPRTNHISNLTSSSEEAPPPQGGRRGEITPSAELGRTLAAKGWTP